MLDDRKYRCAFWPLHEYPDLAKAPDGTLWTTYMSLDGADEMVPARAFRN